MKPAIIVLACIFLTACSQQPEARTAVDILYSSAYWTPVHGAVFGIGDGNGYALSMINDIGEVIHLGTYTPRQSEGPQDVFISLVYCDPGAIRVPENSEIQKHLITALDSAPIYNEQEMKPYVTEFKAILRDRTDLVYEREQITSNQEIESTR